MHSPGANTGPLNPANLPHPINHKIRRIPLLPLMKTDDPIIYWYWKRTDYQNDTDENLSGRMLLCADRLMIRPFIVFAWKQKQLQPNLPLN